MRDVLRRVRAGTLSVVRAERLLRLDAIRRVGVQLKLDLHRAERTGIPEVVLAEGKDPRDVVDAARAFVAAHGRAIITRCPSHLRLPAKSLDVRRHPEAGMVILRRRGLRVRPTGGRVAILTGGASDRRVAAEAEVIAAELGCRVIVERDVGVASLARLLTALEHVLAQEPHAYVVVAGREGALGPVVAGLVPGPVIGVPVSTGYGHGARGAAALTTMLQSCAPMVTVNIDAGFVAGAVAAQVANRIAKAPRLSSAQ